MARVLGLAAALLRLPPVPCGRVHTGVPGTGGGPAESLLPEGGDRLVTGPETCGVCSGDAGGESRPGLWSVSAHCPPGCAVTVVFRVLGPLLASAGIPFP